MSDSKIAASKSVSSESEDVETNLKTLRWPETSIELPSKLRAEEAAFHEECKGSTEKFSNMSDSEAAESGSVSADSEDTVTTNKALPWPETSVELASKLKAEESELPSSTKRNQQYVAKDTIPWQPNEHLSKEINILLLGESGVGKSTFINSFANYMKHENFSAVQRNNLKVLIPARFHIFDKNFKNHLVEIGETDENEHWRDGEAATQDVKTYIFYVTLDNQPYKIRLIDTPGIGDPRGIDQDNKNCDYVLNYIGRLEKIHAICLLLKPTNTRLDVFLNYCVTQILSRLEKSATENIAFLFTNTRGQNYTPGETYTSLELLVKNIKDINNVSLPLSKDNVFCYDNEAFRFLAAVKNGVEFKEGILEANTESWKYSYKEVYRLISYIVNLTPHDPKKTISINHARKMVLQLAQPLAEIVQLIGDNIYEMDQHTEQLLMENQTLEQLKEKLYMPVVDIRVKELPQPVTVCTAPKCSATYKVAGKNKFHYKQRCHNPCYLNNVPAEIVGDPNILNCWAISKSNQTCHQCNCRFNVHMHIYYETETFENKIVDENVLKNINNKEDASKEKQRIINQILNHKEELEKEHKYIIKCTAAFAHFLQENAITPINDSLKEYVKYLITREENLGHNSNRATLDYLRRLLSEYEQERKVLEEALKYDAATNGVIESSPIAIEQKIRDLFTLRHFGKKVKQLYDLHQSGGVIEHKQSEIIVKESYKLSLVDKFKSYGSRIVNKFLFRNSDEQKQIDQVPPEVQMQYFYDMMLRNHPNVPHFPGFTDTFNSSVDAPRNYPNVLKYRGSEEAYVTYNYNLHQQMCEFYNYARTQNLGDINGRYRGGAVQNENATGESNSVEHSYRGKNRNGSSTKNRQKKEHKAIQLDNTGNSFGVVDNTKDKKKRKNKNK